MCEDDIFPPDQVGIFKGELAGLQAINLTDSTTEDDVLLRFILLSVMEVIDPVQSV